MIRKLRVKLVCILMALLTVMLGVTFGLVLHFTQQSLEAESLRTLEALAITGRRPPAPVWTTARACRILRWRSMRAATSSRRVAAILT